MKHSMKITFILLGMFLLTQFIGIAVINSYEPEIKQVINSTGQRLNITTYNLPYGMDPPQDISPKYSFVSIIVSLAIAVILMIILMKLKSEVFLRLWFFAVVLLSIAITLNSVILNIKYSALFALLVALPLAIIKVFKRHILIHNLTELLVYPGIAAIFVPLLNVKMTIILLVIISIYDIYAVWHSGFMQRMANYQIKKLKLFTGFFIPYVSKREREKLFQLSIKKQKTKKIKVHLAILGGGDVVFPIILAGVVLREFTIYHSLIIALGATIALAFLFFFSKKGKFYPAMPFITAGCLIALGISYLVF